MSEHLYRKLLYTVADINTDMNANHLTTHSPLLPDSNTSNIQIIPEHVCALLGTWSLMFMKRSDKTVGAAIGLFYMIQNTFSKSPCPRSRSLVSVA